MKFKICLCELKGLTRPKGPVEIRKTKVLDDGQVMSAQLGGAVKAKVGIVKEGSRYFSVLPRKLGGTQEVPADSLTDALHASVDILNSKVKTRRSPKNARKARSRARKA